MRVVMVQYERCLCGVGTLTHPSIEHVMPRKLGNLPKKRHKLEKLAPDKKTYLPEMGGGGG